jgi:hypothetical protein
MRVRFLHWLTLLVGISTPAGAPRLAAQAEKPPRDFTNIKLEEWGIEPVVPRKDPKTGFIVGGKNDTELIKRLTEINGKLIPKLEKAMRPKALSTAGFLGKDERLLDVLAEDNRYVVDERGLTHQELAKHLHAMGAVWRWQQKHKEAEAPFLYHGRKYRVKGEASRGFQPSPFDDDTKSGSNVKVTNLETGKEMWYGLLVPYMLERYGFYEGHGTNYRLEPRKVLEVFDFIKKQ